MKYPLSYKFKAGLFFISAGVMALFLVLLPGDLSLNPGPTKNFYDMAEILKFRILNDVQSLIHNKCFDIFF